jgi:hypothetical protein
LRKSVLHISRGRGESNEPFPIEPVVVAEDTTESILDTPQVKGKQ